MIGYACITLGRMEMKLRSLKKAQLSEETIKDVILNNLQALDRVLDYNNSQNIRLFRISSDLIPFGSSPLNSLSWEYLFRKEFEGLSQKLKRYDMRVSMHPGQYTVLNSPDQEVVNRAILDLEYHERILDALDTTSASKIVLHVGGVYKNKNLAKKRFVENFQKLSFSLKERIVLENDDKSYTIQDVLELSRELKIPVIFDNLHHQINPCEEKQTEKEWILKCKETWREKDGVQKIHYSQQNPLKKPGSHSETIGVKDFLQFYYQIEGDSLDIMLEVKDKNFSAEKCILCTDNNPKRKIIEKFWARYKYAVLANSQKNYLELRELMKTKGNIEPYRFFELVEASFLYPQKENVTNALEHVWGYFKKKATEKEKREFFSKLTRYQEGNLKLETIKRYLYQLANKYQEEYLLSSYFFYITPNYDLQK